LNSDDANMTNRIPFITFLYADSEGNRKVYHTDWPAKFIADFMNVVVTEIGGFLF